MFVLVQEDIWRGIPLLHIYDDKMTENSPIVLFLHGFQSAKEHNLHYAYQLVKKGVRVIMPDAILHGERTKNYSDMKMTMHFWEIVLTSIKEVNSIYEELKSRGYINSNKIALAGSSMGAITTAGCLKVYDWIDVAAFCMGTPGYIEFANHQIEQMKAAGINFPMDEEQIKKIEKQLEVFDITLDPSRFNERPVVFWHGHKDTTVPFQNTYNFYDKLRSYYKQSPNNLRFIESKDDAHKVSRKGVLAVTEWISHHLA